MTANEPARCRICHGARDASTGRCQRGCEGFECPECGCEAERLLSIEPRCCKPDCERYGLRLDDPLVEEVEEVEVELPEPKPEPKRDSKTAAKRLADDPFWYRRSVAAVLDGRYAFDSAQDQRCWLRLNAAGDWEACGWDRVLKRIELSLSDTLAAAAGRYDQWGRATQRFINGNNIQDREWLQRHHVIEVADKPRHIVQVLDGREVDVRTGQACKVDGPRRAVDVLPVRGGPALAAAVQADSLEQACVHPELAATARALDVYLDRGTWQNLVEWVGVRALAGLEGEKFATFTSDGGGTGKGTVVGMFKEVFGQSALKAKRDVFAPNRSNHNGELKLILQRRPRLVWIEEIAGKKLLTALLKDATGGDAEPMSARAAYDRQQDEVRGTVQSAMVLIGNGSPSMLVDDAILRRWMCFSFGQFNKGHKGRSSFKGNLARQHKDALFALMVRACVDYFARDCRLRPATRNMILGRIEAVSGADPITGWLLCNAPRVQYKNSREIRELMIEDAREHPDSGFEVVESGPDGSNVTVFLGSKRVTFHAIAASMKRLAARKLPRTKHHKGGFRLPDRYLTLPKPDKARQSRSDELEDVLEAGMEWDGVHKA